MKYKNFHEHSLFFNTLRPRQNGRRFADDTFKPTFLNENIQILIKISLKFVPKVPINIIPALVQIMAWRRPGDKPLSEPRMVCLLTHICVTRPQWVKHHSIHIYIHIISDNLVEELSLPELPRCHSHHRSYRYTCASNLLCPWRSQSYDLSVIKGSIYAKRLLNKSWLKRQD